MIDIFFHSIAGKKTHPDIDTILIDLKSQTYISKNDKRAIDYTIEVSKEGRYPDVTYYLEFYQKTQVYNSLSELKSYVKKMKDFYAKEEMIGKVYEVINSTNTKQDFIEGISKIVDDSPAVSDIDDMDFTPKSYDDCGDMPENAGFLLGVPEIDQATNGFQPGTISSICAFTSHGKSLCANSAVYKNHKNGQNGVIFSLEVHPRLVSMMFQSRWLFQERQIEINSQELINRTLTSEKKKLVSDNDMDFKEFMEGLLICDESVFTKSIVLDYRLMQKLFKQLEAKCGCLDFVVFDHIGQFDLIYKDLGNEIIKTIQSACKTYKNNKGLPVTCIFCVQANRDGFKRASKREGKYDLTAISDLNECAAPTTGLLFRGSNGKRIGRGTAKEYYKAFNKERIFAKSVDYETGNVIDTEVSCAMMNGEVSPNDLWYKLKYSGSGENKVFTPNHRILVDGVKIKLEDLPDNFKADCVEWELSSNAYQVLLGTTLGDSISLESPSGKHRVVCYQSTYQLEYLKWKKQVIGEISNDLIKVKGVEKWAFSLKSSRVLERFHSSKTKSGGYKSITKEYLTNIDWLGLVVWYLDDGWIKYNTLTKYYCAFSCTNFGIEGATIMKEVLKEKFNIDCSVHQYKQKSNSKCKNPKKSKLEIQFTQKSSELFMSYVRSFVSLKCMSHKIDYMIPGMGIIDGGSRLAVIKNGLDVKKEEVRYGRKVRKYNFEVNHPDHNYVLPGGLVSANCERSSSYVLFLYTSEDMRITQETKMTLAKNRLGQLVTEPIVTTFNPQVMVIGDTVERVEFNDDFGSLTDNFGDTGFDDFGGF